MVSTVQIYLGFLTSNNNITSKLSFLRIVTNLHTEGHSAVTNFQSEDLIELWQFQAENYNVTVSSYRVVTKFQTKDYRELCQPSGAAHVAAAHISPVVLLPAAASQTSSPSSPLSSPTVKFNYTIPVCYCQVHLYISCLSLSSTTMYLKFVIVKYNYMWPILTKAVGCR